MRKKISVLMSVHNEKKDYLIASVNSIRSQSYNDFELIIIDDFSDLETKELLKSMALEDSRIKLLRNDKNLGLAKSLNKGIEICSGEYIFRMDSDDIAEPTRIEIIKDFLDYYTNIVVCGSYVTLIDENNNKIGLRKLPKEPNQVRKYAPFRNPFVHSAVAFRKSVVKSVGGYNSCLSKAQDYDLWLRLLRNGYYLSNLDKPLIQFRIDKQEIRKKRNYEYRKHDLKVRWDNVKSFDFGFKGYLGLFIPLVQMITPKNIQYTIYKWINKEK